MRKLALLAVPFILLVGCNKPTDLPPTPPTMPAPSVVVSTKTLEPPNVPAVTITATPKPAEKESPRVPTASPSEPATVGVQFAQRWGLRYPNVPEYAILKAANATCKIIEKNELSWNIEPGILKSIEDVVNIAGLPDNDALEFAQDANQNYCASVSNPT